MKDYEDEKYVLWREHVEQVLPGLLKRNLLAKPVEKAETLALMGSPQPKPPSEEKPKSGSTRRSAGMYHEKE